FPFLVAIELVFVVGELEVVLVSLWKLNYLLDKLPNELSLLDNQRLEAYLLWAENVQLHCK
ncbi:hypothetical protein ACXO67_09575, partial [Lactobacillus delbrueckii subsp. bulgaricus]|nr:hypothetical protein [Lactobacillus delbrueckii subsp. bulgaricus]MBT8819946.1 hypothetical protein [Lactobacillus delbrueckii subsp. bulgaricus]MBT8835870.1 hypothetical protein [Lactobacillus delbrueckii subsp. bulgaricus]MBT8883285.1 hypothetical protein [Lactobacillus delbrueckii subsp. bulgaricus]